MHWERHHVNPMLTLRNIVCTERWSEGWHEVITEQQHQQHRQHQQQATLRLLQMVSSLMLLLLQFLPPTAVSCSTCCNPARVFSSFAPPHLETNLCLSSEADCKKWTLPRYVPLFLFLNVYAILKSFTKDGNRGGTWIAMPSRPTPVAVFCASAPEDQAWLRRLETHLSLLKRQGLISFWHDRLISPGTNWKQEIDARLETASVILLLVSADFLASDYCWGIEMTRALERHAANEARVIPILVRPVDWQEAPFAHLQTLPTDERPLAVWRNKEQALTDVAFGIRRMIAAEYYHQTLQADSPLPQRWTLVGGSPWLLSAIVSVGIFLLGSAVAWFLIQLSKIPQPWAGILVAVFALLSGIGGLALNTFSRAFFSDFFKETRPSDSGSTTPFPLSPPPGVSSFAAGKEIRLEIIEAPVRTEKAVSYKNIFLFNEHLLDAKEFFGRRDERITLLDRSSRGSSTSIVGPRRIGKTWLIEYLRYVASDQLGPGYRVAYVNATMPRCDTVSGFTRAALESLGVRILPREASLNLKVLEEAAQMLQEQHIFPILCIDEFEGLRLTRFRRVLERGS